MNKISAVYQIVNTVTNERYVGSSRNVKARWVAHKCPSTWKAKPNNKLYQDMQKYGLDKFRLQILAPVMPEYLKQVEQEFIEMLRPVYNDRNANGWDVERHKETRRKAMKKWDQTNKGKKARRKARRHYDSQICFYNSRKLTLKSLSQRFRRAGIEHPVLEAKKYLLKEDK